MIEFHELIPYAILILGVGLGLLLSTSYFVGEIRKMQVPDFQIEGKKFVLNQGKWIRYFAILCIFVSFIWVFFLNFKNA